MSSNRKFNTNYLLQQVKNLFATSMSRKRLGPVQKATINTNNKLLNDFINLYGENKIKNSITIENIIDKVDDLLKIKKPLINKINKITNNIKLAEAKKEAELKAIIDNNKVAERVLILNYGKIVDEKYNFITNKIEFDKIRKTAPDCFYVQTIRYYDNKGNIYEDPTYNPLTFEYIYKGGEDFKNFISTVNFKMSGGYGPWKPADYITSRNNGRKTNAYSILTTTAYNKQFRNLNIDLNQIYMASDSGHCVYDAFLNHFENKKDDNKNAKAIYNKLLSEKGLLLKKAYTDDTINEIASFCNTTLKIRDLVNNKNKDYINDGARFYIELINTKYNHLDLLKNTFEDIEEVDKEKLYDIKKNADFYIEKNGILTTTEKSYKQISSEFNTIFSEWKNENNFNSLFIYENSDEFAIVNKYDNVLHTFFNKFEVNDKLYNEIDLKKAYFNYSDKDYNKFYMGVPSGAFINIKCNNNFNIDSFDEFVKNELIGYFEVKIIKHKKNNKHFDILGLIVNSEHILTSPQINLLKSYIEFEFLNISYAPSVHIPFSKDFLNKDENGLKHYCKAFGLMLKSSPMIDIIIKPLENDLKYYNTICSEDYDIYKVDNLIKISYNNKDHKNYSHIANFIHSYTRTLIINQLLEMNINDVFGVKLDSIVVKKHSVYNYDKNIFSVKECNIEKMFDTNIRNFTSDPRNNLDVGIDDDEPYINDYNNNDKAHYKPYFNQSLDVLEFKENFIYSGDIVNKRIIKIGGAGGCGKTTSLLSNLPVKNICYTTSCWNLITGQKNKYKGLIGLSIPNLIGECSGKKTEKITNKNIKYIVIDELTLINDKDIYKIIKEYKNCFIFLLGDIDDDGMFYQCTLPTIKIFDSTDVQYIKYNKTFRFNNELKDKLQLLRNNMKLNNNSPNRNKDIFDFVKLTFADRFYDKENVIFNGGDIGISAINDYNNNDNKMTNYFIDKGTKPQYFIKTTRKNQNQLKGQQLDEKPTHNNYECKLFKTIHSFQGLDLNDDNKIIISISCNFDYNLFYTALSRARRCNQIIILNN